MKEMTEILIPAESAGCKKGKMTGNCCGNCCCCRVEGKNWYPYAIGALLVLLLTSVNAYYFYFAKSCDQSVDSIFIDPSGADSEHIFDNFNFKDDEKKSSEENDLEEILKEDFILELPEINIRKKRQIPLPFVPTYPSDTERSDSGVPILENSYQSDKDGLYVPDPTESEGLRLYEGLVATGGKNEPKSLDFSGDREQPVLPHHRVSASWSRKTEELQSRLQPKSGDGEHSALFQEWNHSLPPSTIQETGAKFDQNLNYQRGERRRIQQQPSYVLASSLQNSKKGTFHRNSRVPATDNFLYPNEHTQGQSTRSKQNGEANKSYNYPPLRTLGFGDGEVIARVVQPNSKDSDNQAPLPAAIAHETANNGQNRRWRGHRTQSKYSERRERHYAAQSRVSDEPQFSQSQHHVVNQNRPLSVLQHRNSRVKLNTIPQSSSSAFRRRTSGRFSSNDLTKSGPTVFAGSEVIPIIDGSYYNTSSNKLQYRDSNRRYSRRPGPFKVYSSWTTPAPYTSG